jgi:hypothetical protein
VPPLVLCRGACLASTSPRRALPTFSGLSCFSALSWVVLCCVMLVSSVIVVGLIKKRGNRPSPSQFYPRNQGPRLRTYFKFEPKSPASLSITDNCIAPKKLRTMRVFLLCTRIPTSAWSSQRSTSTRNQACIPHVIYRFKSSILFRDDSPLPCQRI